MSISYSSRVALAVLIGAALTLGACRSHTDVTFIPDGPARSLAEIEKSAEKTDLSAVSGVDVAGAPKARIDVLVWLRTQSAVGDRAASLLTRGFPQDTASVPVYVEVAKVDGARALIVVEAFGAASGPLVHRRLWVFDFASRKLLLSTSFR